MNKDQKIQRQNVIQRMNEKITTEMSQAERYAKMKEAFKKKKIEAELAERKRKLAEKKAKGLAYYNRKMGRTNGK